MSNNDRYFPTQYDLQHICLFHLSPTGGDLKVISWNIQGYSEDKLATIQQYMQKHGIGITCIQEVRKFSSEYFITAEGLLMPCCWVAGRMYKWWHKDYRVEQIWDHIDRSGGKDGIDIINNDLKQVMNGNLLQDIQQSWKLPSIEQGKLGVCAMKCGTEFDPFAEQFR